MAPAGPEEEVEPVVHAEAGWERRDVGAAGQVVAIVLAVARRGTVEADELSVTRAAGARSEQVPCRPELLVVPHLLETRAVERAVVVLLEERSVAGGDAAIDVDHG